MATENPKLKEKGQQLDEAVGKVGEALEEKAAKVGDKVTDKVVEATGGLPDTGDR